MYSYSALKSEGIALVFGLSLFYGSEDHLVGNGWGCVHADWRQDLADSKEESQVSASQF